MTTIITWLKANTIVAIIIAFLVLLALWLGISTVLGQAATAKAEEQVQTLDAKNEKLNKALTSTAKSLEDAKEETAQVQSDLNVLNDDAKYSACIWYWGGWLMSKGLDSDGSLSEAYSQCETTYRDFELTSRSGVDYSGLSS